MARGSLAVIATILLSLSGVACGNSFRRVSMQEPIWETHGMSKNFTGQDMLSDTQPAVREKENLDHPFPATQPDDRDFVEDDNSDNGEWDAQLAYDVVRSKMRAVEKAVTAAQENETHERALVDAASKKFDNASAIYNASAEANHNAYQEWEAVMDALRELAGDATTPDSRISEGITELDKETEDYVECKLLKLSRMHKVEELRQKETELEEAEKAAAVSAVEEKYKRKKEEKAKSEAAKANDARKADAATNQTEAEEAEARNKTTTAAGTEAAATGTTEEPTAAESDMARLKSLFEALEASAANKAAGEEARKSAATKSTQELQELLRDAQAAVEQKLAQRKTLGEQEAQAKAAAEATKVELARTQEAIDAATEKYHKLQTEGDALDSQLKDAHDELAGYKGYAKFSDKDSAFRFSSSGLLLVVIVAARFLI